MDETQIDQSLRLKKLIKELNLNQSSFAKSLGMTQPNISRMVNGESKLSMEVLNGITKAHRQVNLHWLLTGDGEMFFEKSSPAEEPSAGIIIKGTLEERVERLEDELKWLKDVFSRKN